MNNKFILLSTLAFSSLFVGCSNEKEIIPAIDSNNTEHLSTPDEINIAEQNPLYNTYVKLNQLILSKKSSSPQEVLDFLTKETSNSDNISFKDSRDENGNITELVFSSFSTTLTAYFTNNTLDKLNLDFITDNKSMSNNYMNTPASHSISRSFSSGIYQSQSIHNSNLLEGESQYLSILKKLNKSESISLDELEKSFKYISKNEILIDEATPDKSASYQHIYSLKDNGTISIFTSEELPLSICYESDKESKTHYITHTYYTEKQRAIYSDSNTPKAVTTKIYNTLDEQISNAPLLFEQNTTTI